MRVTIVDFGAGNLLSVARAFRHCGADVVLADTPEAVRAAGHLVLPGVGAFADSMRGLAERGLVEPVREAIASGRPFLGICVGMQMMFDGSEEFGASAGLGAVPGQVVRIPDAAADGSRLKVPHVGWAELVPPAEGAWQGTPLSAVGPGQWVYFVHSYAGRPTDRDHVLAECVYGGQPLVAAIRRGNAVGVQFHPEKSGEVGLSILRSFLAS